MPRTKGTRPNTRGRRGVYVRTAARSRAGRRAATKSHIMNVGSRRGRYRSRRR